MLMQHGQGGIRMTNQLIPILAGVVALIMGGVIGALIGRRASTGYLEDSRRLADSVLRDAQKSAENYRKEAEIGVKDAALKMKLDFEEKTRETREALKDRELQLINKDGNVARRVDLLEKKEGGLKERESTPRDESPKAKSRNKPLGLQRGIYSDLLNGRQEG